MNSPPGLIIQLLLRKTEALLAGPKFPGGFLSILPFQEPLFVSGRPLSAAIVKVYPSNGLRDTTNIFY